MALSVWVLTKALHDPSDRGCLGEPSVRVRANIVAVVPFFICSPQWAIAFLKRGDRPHRAQRVVRWR